MNDQHWVASASSADGPPLPESTLLKVRDLKVHFPIRKGMVFSRTVGHVQAVDGVSFDVHEGETFGLVGESGCGKSTLARAILRLVQPTAGNVHFQGQDVAEVSQPQLRSLRRHMQMVFQDPMASLNPRQSVGSILSEPMKAHLRPDDDRDFDTRVSVLLAKVGLPSDAAHRYPHEFSGGQRQRIGIARALALNPALIVADEPVSALDVSVQAQVINLLDELQKDLGLTYIIIAHDLAVVRHISDTVGVMYLGSLVEKAPAKDLYQVPLHPYTRSLLSAVPIPDPIAEDKRSPILLTGDLPSPADPPPGCKFSTRCQFAQPGLCDVERPVLRALVPGHLVACHLAEEFAPTD